MFTFKSELYKPKRLKIFCINALGKDIHFEISKFPIRAKKISFLIETTAIHRNRNIHRSCFDRKRKVSTEHSSKQKHHVQILLHLKHGSPVWYKIS